MRRKTIILFIAIPLAIFVGLYLLVSLITGSFCPPAGWQGPSPPWCEKFASESPFIYQELEYLPENFQKTDKPLLTGIGMMDLWGNPHIAIDLGENSRKLYSSALERVKTIGGEAVLLTDFAVFNKEFIISDADVKNGAGAETYTQEELNNLVKIIKQNKEISFYTTNLYDAAYVYKKALNLDLSDTALMRVRSSSSQEIISKMFPEWEKIILEHADKAEKAGIEYFVINPTDTSFEYYTDLNELGKLYSSLIPKVRKVFSGKIGLFSTLPRIGEMNSLDIDFVIISSDVNADYIQKQIFSNVNDNDVVDIESKFNQWLSEPNWKKFSEKEIYISVLLPSYDGALKEGWIEPKIGEEDKWTKDWKEQALGYEALFRALYDGDYNIDGVFSYGYWWSGQMYPVAKDLRNDIMHSIRDKDAENVFYKWSSLFS